MISVVVPTKGSKDLEDCLQSLKKQTRKPDEIIVVLDSRIAVETRIAKKHGAKIAVDINGTIGGAYNSGAKAARGDIIAFLDDDCIAPKDWLSKIEKEFQEDIDVVSGEDLLPKNSSFFEKAAYQTDKWRIMNRPFYGKEAKNRLKAANIAYRKRVFQKENFNPRLKGLQEPEFHHRLFRDGFKMKFNPSLYVYHKRRSSLKDIFMQIYRNGKAKIELLKLHGDMISFIDVIPPIYTVLFFLLIYFGLKASNWIFLYLLLFGTAAYFLLKPVMIVVKTGEIKYYPPLVLIVFVRELGYFLGILAGLKSIFKRL